MVWPLRFEDTKFALDRKRFLKKLNVTFVRVDASRGAAPKKAKREEEEGEDDGGLTNEMCVRLRFDGAEHGGDSHGVVRTAAEADGPVEGRSGHARAPGGEGRRVLSHRHHQ